MSVEIARVVIDWHERASSFRIDAQDSRDSSIAKLLCTRKDSEALSALLELLGSDGLVITKRGIGWRDDVLIPLIERAKAIAVGPEPAGQEAKDDPQPLPLRVMKASSDQPMAWGVLDEEETIDGDAGHEQSQSEWVLCDLKKVSAVLNSIPDTKEKRERRTYLQTLQSSNGRRLPRVSDLHMAALTAMRTQFPNFVEVIDLIEDHLSLLLLTEAPLSLPALLLLGPPGVGKTFFAKTLTKRLGMEYEMRSMAETTAGFVIVGSTSTWSSAQIGCVAKLLINAPDGKASLFLVDEIDKVTKGNHPPENVLLGLLEPHTAQHFRDEFLDVELDVRPLSVMMTANKALAENSPLASRMKTIVVPTPTVDQMPSIVRSVDAGLREDRPRLGKCFAPLSQDIVDLMAACPPRQVRKALEDAYSKAARTAGKRSGQGRLALETHHFSGDFQIKKVPDPQKKSIKDVPLLVFDQRPYVRIH